MTKFLIERDSGDLINIDDVVRISNANQEKGDSRIAHLKDGRAVAIIGNPLCHAGEFFPAQPGFQFVVPMFDGAEFIELTYEDVIGWVSMPWGVFPEVVSSGEEYHGWQDSSRYAIRDPNGVFTLGDACDLNEQGVIALFKERGA